VLPGERGRLTDAGAAWLAGLTPRNKEQTIHGRLYFSQPLDSIAGASPLRQRQPVELMNKELPMRRTCLVGTCMALLAGGLGVAACSSSSTSRRDGSTDVPVVDGGGDRGWDGPNGSRADSSSSSTGDVGLQPDLGPCVVAQALSPTESLAYVPLAVGDRWTYRGISSSRLVANYTTDFQQILVASATREMDGSQVVVLTDVNQWSGMTEEYLEVTASGLVNHGAAMDSFAPDEVNGAPRYTELAFPIQVCSVVDQFTTTTTTRYETVEATSVAIERALEPTTVPAGTFANTLRLERTLLTTADPYGSPGSPGQIDITDWYAPGLGRVKRLLRTASSEESYELIGSLVGGVGRGVIPLGTIAEDVAIDTTHNPDDVRPAVLYDGTKFLVIAATSTDFSAGGLHGVFVGLDGVASSSFEMIQKIGAPIRLDAAYGDGRYLVAYQVMSGGFYGLLVSANGVAIGSPFPISKGTSGVAVAFGAGVFMVAHTDSKVLTMTPITPQGTMLTDSQPYPGQSQLAPAIAYDGTNFLVAWENEDRDRLTHISAGRVDGLGRAIDVNITSVSQAPGTEEEVDVVFDGTNYVIAWFHRPDRSMVAEGTIRVARVSSDGILLDGVTAGVGGKAVSTTDSPKSHPRIGRLGAQTMVAWEIGPITSIGSRITYRLVGTRVGADGMPLDTSSANEGLWLSALMTPAGNYPVNPEIAFAGDRSLLVYVAGQSGSMLKLADTVIFPW
jgi:hypothetical protein